MKKVARRKIRKREPKREIRLLSNYELMGRTLFKILRKNNALDDFLRATWEQRGRDLHSKRNKEIRDRVELIESGKQLTKEQMIEIFCILCNVDNAITWRYTRQGHEHWAEIREKERNLYCDYAKYIDQLRYIIEYEDKRRNNRKNTL